MSDKKVMRRIAFVGAKPPSGKLANPGGQVTASVSIIEALENQGFSVTIFDTTQASFPVPSFRKRLFKGLSRLLSFSKFALFNRVDATFIFAGAGFSFYERITIAYIAKFFNVKSFFFMRDGHFQTEVNNSEQKRKKIQKIVNIPDYICVQGDSWKFFFVDRLEANADKVLIVRNWLSPDFTSQCVEATKKSEKVVFCFVGWLVKEKGVYELLESAKKLSIDGFDFELIIAGGGGLEEYCKTFVKENYLSSYVKILGWKEKAEIKQIYADSHIFVLPSYAEGFPNSLLEAMSMGLPAIATDVGGIADSLHSDVNGYLIATQSSAELTRAMKEYIINPSKIAAHSREAKRIVATLHDENDNINVVLREL